jgi:tRNA 2-selenouridine synthase SelU
MVLEDMKREEDLLKQVKELYRKQKQELMDYVTQPAVTQVRICEQFIPFRT